MCSPTERVSFASHGLDHDGHKGEAAPSPEGMKAAPGLAPSFYNCHITSVHYTVGDARRPESQPAGQTSAGGFATPLGAPLSRPRNTGLPHPPVRPRTPLPAPWAWQGMLPTTPRPNRFRAPRSNPPRVGAPPSYRRGPANPVMGRMGGNPFLHGALDDGYACDPYDSDYDTASDSAPSCGSDSTIGALGNSSSWRFEQRGRCRYARDSGVLARALESRDLLREMLEEAQRKLAEMELNLAKHEASLQPGSAAHKDVRGNHADAGTDAAGEGDREAVSADTAVLPEEAKEENGGVTHEDGKRSSAADMGAEQGSASPGKEN